MLARAASVATSALIAASSPCFTKASSSNEPAISRSVASTAPRRAERSSTRPISASRVGTEVTRSRICRRNSWKSPRSRGRAWETEPDPLKSPLACARQELYRLRRASEQQLAVEDRAQRYRRLTPQCQRGLDLALPGAGDG